MSKDIKLLHCVPALNEDSVKVVEALWESYRYEYCHNYQSLEDKTGLDLDKIKSILQPLKRLGMVKAVNGLRNEEGEVAGSGFWVCELEAQQLLELALYRYNYNDRPFGRPDDFVPKRITVGEYSYSLEAHNE